MCYNKKQAGVIQTPEKAKQYLEANELAIKNIYSIIEEENIDCDFDLSCKNVI